MPTATHISLQLARFDSVHIVGPTRTQPPADGLFCGVGADWRAAGTDPARRVRRSVTPQRLFLSNSLAYCP